MNLWVCVEKACNPEELLLSCLRLNQMAQYQILNAL